MAVRNIAPGVDAVGSIDWNRRLFDELVPLPEGTSYNAYLVRGSEKTALIDTVDPVMAGELLDHLKKLGVKKIDYVLANHAEQDHSGSIPEVLKAYPDAKVVTNAKCKSFLTDLLVIPEEKFLVIEDRTTLPLGGKTLEFILFPWVHWPETMLTYDREDKILFSCDLFGSHVSDTRLTVEHGMESEVYEGAFRYFSEIMYPFRDIIRNNLPKIRELAVDLIAPSHGPCHRNAAFIMDSYAEWTSDALANKVVIPYVSMHGSTEIMVKHLTDALVDRGVEVRLFKMSVTDIGHLAMSVTDAATVVVGCCQVLSGMHPLIASAVFLLNMLRPKTKFLSIVGSYGWGGKMVEQIQAALTSVKAEIIPPVIARGLPKQADLNALDALADAIAEKHRALGILKKGD